MLRMYVHRYSHIQFLEQRKLLPIKKYRELYMLKPCHQSGFNENENFIFYTNYTIRYSAR